MNEAKELEIHMSQNIRLQWVLLNEALQHITLELQSKLVNDTIKVQYQLLDIIHFIAIFPVYEQLLRSLENSVLIDRKYWKEVSFF